MNLENKEANSNFATGLQNKDIKLVSSALSESCTWYSGQHFGTVKGKIACLNHIKMTFNSFPHLNFVLKQTAVADKVSVWEYGFVSEEKAKGYLKPTDYSGIFVLEFIENSIQSIKAYYVDRTKHPRHSKSDLPIGGSSPINTEQHNIDYDPVTGLPL